MHARLSAFVAAAAVAVAVIPAHATGSPASGPRPQITDPSGDANGLNDQGSGIGTPASTNTAVDASAADITGLTFQTTFKTVTTKRTMVIVTKKKGKVVKTKRVITTTSKVPTGSTITLTTAAAPDANTEYVIQVTSSGAACKSVWFIYNSSASPLYKQNRGVCEDDTGNVTMGGPSGYVTGSTLVWTLPLSVFPVGTTFSEISADTLPGLVPGLTIDQTESSPFAFTVGK